MEQKVAIVIPCRNEEQYISKCLHSLVNQTYPLHLLKIIVVDGQSTDNTKMIVSEWSKKYSEIILLENIHKTTPYALNIGIQNAKDCDLIMILGAHAELDTTYIQFAVEIMKNNPAISCVGGVLKSISENHTTDVISKAMSSPFGVGNAYFRTGLSEGFVDTVAFGLYRSEVFNYVGLFDEELVRNQDDEFNYRILKKGFKIFLSRKLAATYYVRTSFKNLFRQFYQYGYWKVYVNKKHRTITTLRQLVPFLFVMYLFFLFIALVVFSSTFIFLLIPLLIYIIVAISVSFQYYSNILNNVQLVWAFFVLHISYGLGYAKGILDFYVLSKKMNKKDEKLSR
ncbi:MAG: glycosyltransferase family 2 protein [Bacteroidales bacterium]|nr:glycosyltransferase family 2 protein [Bacteroidales bacterium]